MPRIDLPNEQWAELRDVTEFRQKDRRIAAGAFNADLGGPALQFMAHQDRVIILALKNWSLDLPLPTIEDPASIDALDFPTYDALSEAIAPVLGAMRGDKEQLGDVKDPESPPEPSSV